MSPRGECSLTGMNTTPPGPRVHLRSEESGGEVSVIETRPAPGTGPPLHHHDFDEAFYVLEGELTFQLRDELRTVGPGELVFAPRGVPHTFANLTDKPAHQLIVCTPGGFERYFARMAAEAQGFDPPEWAQQPTPEVTHVGPPIDPAPAAR
jgi:quercetin dioxygenase-like cupin family protein